MPAPSAQDFNILFNQPPEEAINYLKNKGYKIGWNWQDTLDDAHARAFTVAKVARIDILQDIKKSLVEALEKGETLEQWKAKLTPTLQEKGWWGKQVVTNPDGLQQEVQLGSSRRLDTIFNTNMQSAYAAGRFKSLMDSVETRPYWQWLHVSVIFPRREHLALNMRLFSYDDPFWSFGFPPIGWGCKCRVVGRSRREVERNGWNIETSDGKTFTYTEVIGKNSAGQDIKATINAITLKDANGAAFTVAPKAGFNSSPLASHTFDNMLLNRASGLMPEPKALQQLEQVIVSPARISAHQAFVNNALSFGKTQRQSISVGVLDEADINFLSKKNIVPESPLAVLEDRLIVGKKGVRHGSAGNALDESEWREFPKLMEKPERVLWDVPNQSLLFILPALVKQNPDAVIKVAVKAQNGFMEVVSVFKVVSSDLDDGIKSNSYEVVR